MRKRTNAHTEGQAWHLWCPMARYTEGDSAANRWPGSQEEASIPPPNRCVASQCAMWRWLTDETGYCGLGGEP
jgi:hypothetical protein